MRKPIFGLGIITLICCQNPLTDNLSDYVSINDRLLATDAFVRLYSAPIRGVEGVASHPWFIVKPAGFVNGERWEVGQSARTPYFHIRKSAPNLTGVGGGSPQLIAEIVGPSAETIVAFIQTQSPQYKCRFYYFFTGPNSNTYPQWVLLNTGWQVALPDTSVGKEYATQCN